MKMSNEPLPDRPRKLRGSGGQRCASAIFFASLAMAEMLATLTKGNYESCWGHFEGTRGNLYVIVYKHSVLTKMWFL